MTLLGWALMHSVWQCLVLALGLASVLGMTRSARVRYAAGLVSMALMVVVFAVTLALSSPETTRSGSGAIASSGISIFSIPPAETLHDVAQSPLQFLAPYFSMFWIAGVCGCHLWQLAGLVSVRRLRSCGVWPAPQHWEQQLRSLASELGVTRSVVLLESMTVYTPIVIGHLRPLILIPVGMLTRLPADHVAAILLHELAHIRRCDYVVNLMQRWVEGLFFYHPAMWWMSHVVRLEREACCDDLAAAATGSRRQYAGALAALEEIRFNTQDLPAMAATGGSLHARIERLLRKKPASPARAIVSLLTIVVGASALAFAGWQTRSAESAEKAPVTTAQFSTPRPRPVANAVGDGTSWQKWLNEDAVYLITEAEQATFNRLQTEDERQRFVEDFWLRRGSIKKEHYRRIAYANERFGAGNVPGWQTDRGRIYIVHGPPAEIESHPAQGGLLGYSHWRYRTLPDGRADRFFTFADVSNTGDYKLQTADNGQAALFNRMLRWTVVDPLNRFVTGLRQEHIEVREKGQAKSIAYFEAPGIPTAVAVVSAAELTDLDSIPSIEALIQTKTIDDAVAKLRAAGAARKALIVVRGLDAGSISTIPGGIAAMVVDASGVRRTIMEIANQYVGGYHSDSSDEPELLVKPVAGLPVLRIAGR
ncbi:MAG TPA: M56 family metallopeptidase [Bryobacteraceae bacterium]|nr:M56 family metallopeptidase [Bryobacteraceae bacterium]